MADEESEQHVEDSSTKKRKTAVSGKEKKSKKIKLDLSTVKNKLRRQELYKQLKHEKNKEKKDKRKKQRKDENWEEKKQIPKTTENMRVKDETLVDPEDEEVLADELTDELSSYFKCERIPKILITTSSRPKCHETMKFVEDLKQTIPNSEYHERKGIDIKKMVPQAIEKEFTDILVVNEDHKKANALLVCHLPNGPTAHFKISNVRRRRSIKNHGKATSHRPELVLNNFNTRLGHSVGRLLAALFPYDPQFQGRRCITFHNQRDFIFFRHHRYIFKNKEKVGLQELGPRFTLKLRWLQKGTFDTKYGEYEWIHKRREMDTSRRKFFL
ncbi:ribosome production factor 1-like [Rhopilema esculentum]|uniref:ribosome production factor 1-like n=1 Tax=Rhopilema esculentum TaxID=499914 RepID=UPI0031D12CBC